MMIRLQQGGNFLLSLCYLWKRGISEIKKAAERASTIGSTSGLIMGAVYFIGFHDPGNYWTIFIVTVPLNEVSLYLKNLLLLVYISLSRCPQQMNCTLQMPCSPAHLPSRLEACYCCSQSAGESCPVRARTRRSNYRSRVCSHPTLGRNLQSRQIASERPSNLHRLLFGHRTLQIHPNHQDRFWTLHWSCYQICKFRRSSGRLEIR